MLLYISAFGTPKSFRTALTLGTSMGMNRSREDCIWRKDTDPCPDSSIKFSLYKMLVIMIYCNFKYLYKFLYRVLLCKIGS